MAASLPPETTARRALADAVPRFPMRAALTRLIQVQRQLRRAGRPAPLASRADLDRLLDSPLTHGDPAAVGHAKALLGKVLDGGEDPLDAAAAAGDALLALVPRVVQTPVSVQVTGWPLGFGRRARLRRLSEVPDADGLAVGAAVLQPGVAARVVHALDGERLGGSVLRVAVDLPDGGVLPPLARQDRARPVARGRGGPWLPHVDEVGRASLTPEVLARATAAAVRTPRVIDAFAGCGGDAVALAQAGHEVVALERDPGRAALCRRNVSAVGLTARVQVHCVDAHQALADWRARWPDAAVHLDPPWGAAPLDGAPTWADLFHDAVTAAVLDAPQILAKLPRTFDVASLPDRAGGWDLRWRFGDAETGGGHVVKLLLAVSAD